MQRARTLPKKRVADAGESTPAPVGAVPPQDAALPRRPESDDIAVYDAKDRVVPVSGGILTERAEVFRGRAAPEPDAERPAAGLPAAPPVSERTPIVPPEPATPAQLTAVPIVTAPAAVQGGAVREPAAVNPSPVGHGAAAPEEPPEPAAHPGRARRVETVEPKPADTTAGIPWGRVAVAAVVLAVAVAIVIMLFRRGRRSTDD